MKPVTRIFNFDNVPQAREFLSELYLGGKKVTRVKVEAGEWVEFKDCTDSQAVAFAQQLYQMQPKQKWRHPESDKLKEVIE